MGTDTHLCGQLTIQCEKLKTRKSEGSTRGNAHTFAQIINQGNTLAHIINQRNTHTFAWIFN
jgi:hypothetical protein